MITGAVSAGITAWSIISRMEMRKKKKEGMEENTNLTQEDIEKEKLKEHFLGLFRLYEDWEFETFLEFGKEDVSDLREYAADYYAEKLYLYIKKNMKMIPSIERDDGTGQEPYLIPDKLFHEPACLLCRQPCEDIYDSFHLVQELEIWILESGKFAVVTSIYFEKDGWQCTFRFQDKVIREPVDIPITFEDLEIGLLQFMKEEGVD